jgi:hypothetical protein
MAFKIPQNWRRTSISQAQKSFFLDLACARELLSRGADPNLCSDNGEPILGMVISSAELADAFLFELFLDYGARLLASYSTRWFLESRRESS